MAETNTATAYDVGGENKRVVPFTVQHREWLTKFHNVGILFFNTIITLRQITDHNTDMVIGCFENFAIYSYDSESTSVDDGENYLRPDNVDQYSAGRWVLRAKFDGGNIELQFYNNRANFPLVGSESFLYIDKSNGRIYRWSNFIGDYIGMSVNYSLDSGMLGGQLPVYYKGITQVDSLPLIDQVETTIYELMEQDGTKAPYTLWAWDGAQWNGVGGSIVETDPLFQLWLLTHQNLVQDANYVHTDNNYTNGDAQIVANTSGTNTGDQVADGVTITGTGSALDPFVAVNGIVHEHTYAELLALCTANELKIGDLYLLTDYETTYTQPVTNLPMGSGVIEPLLLKASSVNTFETICSSALYPQDIISYDINDSSEGFTKGKIFRRNDTINSIDAGTDWRHVKYFRAELDVTTAWVQGNNYTVGDIVTTGYDIYICTLTHTNSGDVNTNFYHYPFGNGDFASLYSTGQPVYIGDVEYIIPVSVNFEDRLKFGSDCSFQKWDMITFDNIVIGDSNAYWTIGNGNYYWTVGNSNAYLTVGNGNYYLTVGNSNYSWTIGNGNSSWTVGNSNYSWTIGNGNSFWTVGNRNAYLTVGNGNYYWTVGNSNAYLTVGNGNYYLTVGNGNYYWTVGNSNAYLTVGNSNYSWTIGNGNSSWTVGNLFYNYEIKNNTSNITPPNISRDYLKIIYKAGTKKLLEYTDEFEDINIIEL